jgi:hypothetical protein
MMLTSVPLEPVVANRPSHSLKRDITNPSVRTDCRLINLRMDSVLRSGSSRIKPKTTQNGQRWTNSVSSLTNAGLIEWSRKEFGRFPEAGKLPTSLGRKYLRVLDQLSEDHRPTEADISNLAEDTDIGTVINLPSEASAAQSSPSVAHRRQPTNPASGELSEYDSGTDRTLSVERTDRRRPGTRGTLDTICLRMLLERLDSSSVGQPPFGTSQVGGR